MENNTLLKYMLVASYYLLCSLQPNEPRECPNVVGCGKFLEAMKAKHRYRAKKIKWGYTTLTNVLGDFSRTTIEFSPGRHDANWEASARPPWRIFKCKTCGFLTHATRDAASTSGDGHPHQLQVNSVAASRANRLGSVSIVGASGSTAAASKYADSQTIIAIVMNLMVTDNITTDYTLSNF